MKIKNIEIILDNMSSFEFWIFMGYSSKERWRILRKKGKKL